MRKRKRTAHDGKAGQLAERDARRLLDTSPAVHYVAEVKDDFGARYVSEGITAQLGYEPSQLTDDPGFWLSRVHPDDRDRVTAYLRQPQRNDSYVHEYRFLDAQGKWRWLRERALLVRDHDDDALVFLGSRLDVTEQKRIETNLHELNEKLERHLASPTADVPASRPRLRAIMDTVSDAIVTIDEHGVIEDFNRAAESMFGYRADEALGRNMSVLMPFPHRDEHDRHLRRNLEDGERRLIGAIRELEGQRKDGTTFPIMLSVSEIDSGRFMGIVRDITERKALQAQVLDVAAREQRRIGRELHDNLQQWLTGIGLLAKNLSEMLQQESPAACRLAGTLCARVAAAHEEVRSLVHGLVPEAMCADGFRLAVERLARQAGEIEGISCTFVCPEHVNVDDEILATHLYRIAQEAVTNALKHARASRIVIALRKADDVIRLEVRDDGIGIGGQRKPHGALGLGLMRYRCDLIGAALRIEPAKNRGTVVAVTCPHAREDV